jgi:hypothetical protein
MDVCLVGRPEDRNTAVCDGFNLECSRGIAVLDRSIDYSARAFAVREHFYCCQGG